jgi:hypothetical protein
MAAIIAVLIFKKEIGRFIERTKTITKDGVVTDTNALATQEVKNIAKPSAADELLKSFDNQLLLEQETLITDFLGQKNVHAPAERERVLVRYLASAYIINRFEGIYHSIWGSQLRALEVLNEGEPQGLPRHALEAWYEVGRTGYPERFTNYPFDDWFRYLQGMTLVFVAADGQVHITVFGNEFLKYLVQNTYITSKAG